MLARLLGVNGALGKQLDSLADLITFGVAPAFIVFQLFFWIESQHFFNPLDDWPKRGSYSQKLHSLCCYAYSIIFSFAISQV